MRCYCHSSKPYDLCCGPYHNNKEYPQTPETLMRSRYSAFALRLVDYLVFTSSTPLNKRQSKSAIRHWAQKNTWTRLEVLSVTHSQVEFKASYTDADHQPQVHHELSDFIIEDGQWKYDRGIIDPISIQLSRSRNVPCPCGSGKKYKRCCG